MSHIMVMYCWCTFRHRNFAAYKIPHLRSPADVHPGPHDMRELLGFAHVTQRNGNDFDLTTMISMPRDDVFKGLVCATSVLSYSHPTPVSKLMSS